MKNPKVELSELEFCVFDLETTGGNHEKDGIIEIGLVVVKNNQIIFEKNYLINPQQKIPDFIQKLTTITDRDVENCPIIEDVMGEILSIMSDRILVAHNTSFDVPFFNSVLTRLGKDKLSNKSICTNLMTKFLIPNILSTNLTYMSKVFGINHGTAHRALDDAKASAKLLIKYLDIFAKKNIEKINHLYYPRNKYELDRLHLKSASFTSEKFTEILDKITAPYLCSIKGEKGTLEYVIPLLPNQKSKNFILQKLINEKSSWETFTLQIFGSFSEAYINFMKYASKLKYDSQNDIESDLVRIFNIDSKELESMISKFKNNADHILKNELGSFIVVGHLVENQYIIFNSQMMTPKNMLIFKFPAHQKKLQQFINSRLNKKVNARSVSQRFYSLFILISQKNDESIMKTIGNLKKKQVPEILLSIEHLLSKYEYTHEYPQKYI